MTFREMTTNVTEFQTHCINHYIKYKLSKYSERQNVIWALFTFV